MKKAIQKEINAKVEAFIDYFNATEKGYVTVEDLRSCKAKVYTFNSFYVLKSYGTIVAVVDRDACVGYDFLRKVYGYTATSAQHISKFFHDYLWSANCTEPVYTWRDC